MSSNSESEAPEMLELQVETDEEEEYMKDEEELEDEDNGRSEEDEEEDEVNGRSEDDEEEEDTKDREENEDSEDDNLDLTLMQPVPGSAWHIVWSNDGSYVFCNLATKALEWEVPKDLVGRDDVQDIIAKGPSKGPQAEDHITEDQGDVAMEDSEDSSDEVGEDFLGFEDTTAPDERPSKNGSAALTNSGNKLVALRERQAKEEEEKETRATKEESKPGHTLEEQLIYDEYGSDIDSDDLMSGGEERPQSQSVEHKRIHERRLKRNADEQKNGESSSSESDLSQERKKRKQPDHVSEQDNRCENDGVRERQQKRKYGSKTSEREISSQSECVDETTSPKRRDQRGSLVLHGNKRNRERGRQLRSRDSSAERDSEMTISSGDEASPKRDWNKGPEQKRHKRPQEQKRSNPSVAGDTKHAEFSCVEELKIYNLLSGREKKSHYTQTLQDFQDTRACFNYASSEEKRKAYMQHRKAKGDYYRLKLCMWIEKSAAKMGDKSSGLYQKFLDTTMVEVSKSKVLFSKMPSNVTNVPDDSTELPVEIYSYEDVEEERKWDTRLRLLEKDVEKEIRRSIELKAGVGSAKKNDGEEEDIHQDLSKKKDIDAKLQLLASTEATDVVPVYYQRAAEGQVLLERCSEPLLGVQYVVEVRRDSATSLDTCVFICVMCTKRLNSTMLLSHLQSVPHKLKFAELHYPDEYEQYKAFTSEMWTPAKIKKFNADIDKVDMKKGRFKLAVASEKNMTFVLAAIKENIRVIRSGGELEAEVEVVEEKPKPDPKKEKAKLIKNFRRAEKRLSVWHQDTKTEYNREPDKHPRYREEWKRFWRSRHDELKAEGRSSRDVNLELEWREFWIPRMAILIGNNYDDRREDLFRRHNLKESDL